MGQGQGQGQTGIGLARDLADVVPAGPDLVAEGRCPVVGMGGREPGADGSSATWRERRARGAAPCRRRFAR
jgi:hypothetical protein